MPSVELLDTGHVNARANRMSLPGSEQVVQVRQKAARGVWQVSQGSSRLEAKLVALPS